jgi:hypothetical protein
MRYLPILFLVACAAGVNTEERINAWIGHDLEEIVGAWGHPTFESEQPDGQTIYTWRHSESYTAPNNSSSDVPVYTVGTPAQGGSRSGGNTFYYWCDKSFTVNTDGVLTAGSWRGNACN